MNDRMIAYLIRRDFSSVKNATCLYCKGRIKLEEPRRRRRDESKQVILDHLDGKQLNNDYANLALAHRKCVEVRRKGTGAESVEYQNIADDKRVRNKEYVPLLAKDASDGRNCKGRKATMDIYELVTQRLEQKVGEKAIPLNDLSNSITRQLHEEGIRVNPRTVRHYVDVICLDSASWQIKQGDKGRKAVSRRAGASLAAKRPS